MKLWRMQDAEGRGPFRPGFSATCTDDSDELRPPAVHEELGLGKFQKVVAQAHKRGFYIGSACTPEQFREWFTSRERVRLAMAGFRIHEASACRIIVELNSQVIIASKRPFSKLPRAETAALAAPPAQAARFTAARPVQPECPSGGVSTQTGQSSPCGVAGLFAGGSER